MKAETPLIPDVDPSGGVLVIDPLIYGGGRWHWRKPNSIAVIRKNAGLMPADKLAAAMGISEARLRRIAREEHIDLTFPRPDQRKEEHEPRGA